MTWIWRSPSLSQKICPDRRETHTVSVVNVWRRPPEGRGRRTDFCHHGKKQIAQNDQNVSNINDLRHRLQDNIRKDGRSNQIIGMLQFNLQAGVCYNRPTCRVHNAQFFEACFPHHAAWPSLCQTCVGCQKGQNIATVVQNTTREIFLKYWAVVKSRKYEYVR